MTFLYQDFETRSCLDLSVVGLDRYVKSSTTEDILLAWAIDDASPSLWQRHLDGGLSGELRDALADPHVIKVAWNSQFERHRWMYGFRIDIPHKQWEDPMIQSRFMSMPGYLEEVSKILKLDAEAKMSWGTKKDPGEAQKLIKMFCEPSVAAKDTPLFGRLPAWFRDWDSDPEMWHRFGEYCKQDLIAMRAIKKKLCPFPLPEDEKRVWAIDREINERGVYCDRPLAEGCSVIAEQVKSELHQKIRSLTGVENPNSNPQILEWIRTQGYTFSGLAKGFVTRAMDGECELTPVAREVLELRKQSAKTSDSKLGTILDSICDDGRLRHQYAFMGASRTGRWSGKGDYGGAQLQNLPRPSKAVAKRLDEAIELLRAGDYLGLALEFPSPMDAVTTAIRSIFRAAPGKKLLVCDLNAVENRVLGWLTGCDAITEVFRQGKCPYLSFAVKMYGIPYEELKRRYDEGDEEVKEMRQNAKPPVLGCFGADTLVLTDNGWKPIVAVCLNDKVFDGLQFVEHNGIIYQGKKAVTSLFGVDSTPDHLIQISENEWQTCKDVLLNTPSATQALDLARGSLSNLYGTATSESISASVLAAGNASLYTEVIWNAARQNPVSLVRTSESSWKRAAYTLNLTNREPLSTDWRIAITPLRRAAGESDTLVIATEDEAYDANSEMFTSSSGMFSLYRDTTTPSCNSTGKTTTATTPEEISASSHPESITAINQSTALSIGTGEKCPQSSSGNRIVRAIGMSGQSPEKSEKAYRLTESSPSSPNAVVPTFDILNAGPRNRYMILTQRGPLLVHNCGYQLSGGEEKIDEETQDKVFTGLMNYARGMGVEMPHDLCHKAVDTFRGEFLEVPEFWYASQDAALEAVRRNKQTSIGPLTFRPHGSGLLQMILPSGRPLNYIRPKIERDERFDKEGITYEGKDQKTHNWTRIKGYGGKWTEQSDQGMSRDLLVNGMFEAKKIGLEIVSHTHDELVCEVDKDSRFALDDLRACMIKIPDWAPGLILDAEGFVSEYYKK